MRRVLKLLENPYSENVELEQQAPVASSSGGSSVSDESCSSGTGKSHAERVHYDCKPPMWAMDLQVT